MTQETEKIVSVIKRLEVNFYAAHPDYTQKDLKGRKHIARASLASVWLSELVCENTELRLRESISLGLHQGYDTIFPAEFVVNLAQELGCPVCVLSNSSVFIEDDEG